MLIFFRGNNKKKNRLRLAGHEPPEENSSAECHGGEGVGVDDFYAAEIGNG